MPLSELGQRGLGAGLGTQGERGLRVKEVPGPRGRGRSVPGEQRLGLECFSQSLPQR